MTYFEKLLDTIQFVVERHRAAYNRNCSDKVKKELAKRGADDIKINFVRYQPEDGKESDYDYLLFEARDINIELRNDLESLFYNFKLNKPEYFNSFPSAGVNGPGFMVRMPKGWVEKYRYKEFDETEQSDECSMLYWHDYKCSDENLDKRYKHFSDFMERFIK